MKYEYRLENLHCANCAAKIENRFDGDPDFKDVALDFSRKILYFETEKQVDTAYISKEIDKIESGIVVMDRKSAPQKQPIFPINESHQHDHDHQHHHDHDHANCHDHNHDHADAHAHEHDGYGHSHNHADAHDHGHGHSHDNDGLGRNFMEYIRANTKKLMRIIAALLLFGSALILGTEHAYAAVLLIVAYVVIAYDVLWYSVKHISRGQVFDENFLMSVATLGAFAIGEFPEGVAVMIFYQVGEFLQDMAVDKSRRSIAEKMDLRIELVRVVTPNGVEQRAPEDVRVGDLIVVQPNEKLALDGIVQKGESFMQTASITGESRPKHVAPGTAVLSGFINGERELTVKATSIYAESTVSKIIELVERASGRKAQIERFITRFAKYYTPIVVFLALFVAVIPPLLLGDNFQTWIYRSLIFLVVSCPCALVISIPLGFFAGLGATAKAGIVVKGGNHLESLGKVKTIIFDKTGTLTKGNFKIADVAPQQGVSKDDLIQIAVTCESHSSHPIAKAIVADAKVQPLDWQVDEFTELSGQGLQLRVGEDVYSVGSAELMAKNNISYQNTARHLTTVHIAKNDQYLGSISLADEIKSESKRALKDLKSIKKVLISGDAGDVVDAVAQKLDIAEAYGNRMPADKLRIVEQHLNDKSEGLVAFVGDGSNDAPVLAAADVGIAMGGVGTDVAIEAADMMIMEDDLTAIPKAIKISKKTMRIIYQNIGFALGIKILVMILGVFGIANMWLAVFADVGVTLLAVLNALRILWSKY